MLLRIVPQSNALAWLRGAATLLAGSLMLTGCGAGHETDCLKSNGPTVTQRRAIGRRVRSVAVFNNVDLTIVPDTAAYAEVTAGEHVIDGLTLTTQGATNLLINNTNTCNWTRSYDTPYAVRLHLPPGTYLNLEQRGYGTLRTASQLARDTLFVHLVGAGDVNLDVRSKYMLTDMYELGDMTLNGIAEEFHPIVGGYGFLYAGGLQSNICYFETTSTSLGDGHVRTSQLLAGQLNGRGTFYYAGTPKLIVKGAGKLLPE